MTLELTNINILWAGLMVEELVRNGIDYFVISPGSRSTPLTVAIARNPRSRIMLSYDERSAAFHALGYARATNKPAVLVCTSGTAVANYMPAVVEADVDKVPLLIFSADRPPELRQTMANQTVDQPHLFGRLTRWQFDMPTPTTEIAPEMVLTTADQAIHRARRTPSGPVHLNFMFREPLAPTQDKVAERYLVNIEHWRAKFKPYSRYVKPLKTIAHDEYERLAELLSKAQRGILVVGQLINSADQDAVMRLALALNWPVFPDITSGIRLGTTYPQMIHHFDHALISHEAVDNPDIIVHIGGQLVSKRLLQYFSEVRTENYVVVNPNSNRYDAFHGVSLRLEADVSTCLSTLIHSFPQLIHREADDWLELWKRRNRTVSAEIVRHHQDQDHMSESGVAWHVSHLISEDTGLWMGSSMPIRDMDWFAVHDRTKVPVAANRGASGIDGTIASAAGYAMGLRQPVTLILGDLSFLHDVGSLSMLRDVTQPICIIVVNNQGGGIFRMLPIAQFKDVFEPFFETPHRFDFAPAGRMYGVDYFRPKSKVEFFEHYLWAQKSGQHAIIEVQTDRAESVTERKALREAIEAALNP